MADRFLPARYPDTRRLRIAPWYTESALVIFLAAALVFLIVVGLVTNHAVREYLNDNLAEDLETLLAADVAALQLWADRERRETQLWARSPALTSLVASLSATAPQDTDVPTRLCELLSPETGDADSRGFVIVSPSGDILASSPEGLAGRRLASPGIALILETLKRGVLLSRPLRTRDDLGLASASADERVILTAARIQDAADRDIGVLVFLLDPRNHFSRILSVARLGEEGDTYAFDRDGLMLSESRFGQQLRELGLIPEGEAGSVLTVQIRNPGGDLTRGFQPPDPPAARPLTRMAASATQGASAVDVTGYRDYRGVRVVGAWQWIPELELGVATEIPARRAFGALRPLKLAFGGLFGLLAFALGMVVFTGYRVQRLRRRVAAFRELGQYTLEEKIGEGGMGEVYRARHALLKRPTAVKLLKGSEATTESIARFEREVQITSRLTHPNTIEVYDFGRTPDGVFYYAMEYLDGVDLSQLIELSGPQPVARVVHILVQVCNSLAEAHAVGLIHRDVKPLNIMLCERGGVADSVKVLDFGLVTGIDAADHRLTSTESVHGTPLYIPPERMRDPTQADACTDIYALGGVAFNLLTGRDLFEGGSTMELCYHVLNTPAPRAASQTAAPLPDELDALVAACLEKDPAARPADIAAMMPILEALAEKFPWPQSEACRWWNDNRARIRASKPEAAGSRPEA